MKKETEYQAGVEKINKNLDYVSTLPVANEVKRQYLQDKVNQMTTSLNQNVNTDWSNQSIQQLTSNMITSIGKDPVVQGAVSDAVNIQKHYKKFNQDEQENGAAAQANRTYFEENFLNPYLNSTDVNQRFHGEYTEYQDADAWANENIQKIKPEWRKIDHLAQDIYATDKDGKVLKGKNGQPIVKLHAYQQWSKETESWKEVPEYEIKNVIELGLRNNPSMAKQLEINAYSATKNFTEDIYADKMKAQRAQIMNYNNRAIEYFTDVVNGVNREVPDEMKNLSAEQIKSAARTKIEQLKKLNLDYLNYNPELDKAKFRDPQWNERIRNDYYNENFIQEKLSMFGGKKEYTLTYEGDPFQKEMQIKQYNESVATRIDQANHWKTEMARNKERDEVADRKWAAEHPELTPGGKLYSQESVTSDVIKDTDASFSTVKKNSENAYNSGINLFLYDNLKNSDLVNQLFTRDSNGNISIKPDANGSITANQEKVRQYMEKFYKAVEPGNSEHKTNINGNDVRLDEETVHRLAALGVQNNLVKNYQRINDEMDKARRAEGKDNLDKKVDNLKNNIAAIAKKNGFSADINDLNNLISKVNNGHYTKKDESGKEIIGNDFLETLLSGVEMKPASPNSDRLITTYNQAAINAFDKKYGGQGSWQKYYAMYNTKDIHDVLIPSSEDIDERKNFNNDYLKAKHVVPVAQAKLLTTGKSDENKQLRNDLKRFKEINDLIAAGANKDMYRMFNPKDDASSTLTVKAVIDPASKDKYLLFSDNSTKKPVAVKMTDPNADAYFNAIPQQYDSPIVQMVRSNPHYSTYENNDPTWEKSIIVDKQGNYEERVGLVYNSGTKSWTMHIYKGYTNGQIKEHKTRGNLDLEPAAKEIDNLMIENGYVQR